MFAYLPLEMKLYIWALAFALGAVMGSAMNCLAYRMVREQGWRSGRSKCPHCGHTLGGMDLVPLLSFLLLKGKCRYCGAKLSNRYFLAELILGIAYVALVARFGFSLDTVSALVLVTCLLTLSLVDLDIQIIPDRFLIISAAVRLIQLTWERRLLPGLIPSLVLGGGLLGLSLVMDKVLKKESMGGGDIKLLAVLGLYVTLAQGLLLVILACVIGILMAKVTAKSDGDGAFPFGPALSLSALVTMLAGEPIVGWYLSLL